MFNMKLAPYLITRNDLIDVRSPINAPSTLLGFITCQMPPPPPSLINAPCLIDAPDHKYFKIN